MASISTYPILSNPTINDILIGTDVQDLNITKNFSIGSIIGIVGTQFVPYTGATGNVNLGAFNITSSSFIVPGGLSSQFLKANGTLDSTVYVPATRTLTINSVSYNLSADRSWDLNTIDTLTTTGTGGAATYIGKTLNIPQYQAQGNYITQLSGEATAVGPGNATVTLSNLAVISKILTGLNVTGGTVVDTDSILIAFGKVQNQLNGLTGGVTYQGTWNAATNIPFLQSSVGTKGYYYVVSVPGNTNLNGITNWQLGDWAIYNGTAWEKVDNTDAVVSVNGYTGAVVLTYSDVGAPPATRNLTINGVQFDLSADRTWTVGDVRTDQTYADPSWITSLGWSKITGTPTTLAGYGITDGALNTTELTINGVTFNLSANRTWNVGTVTSVGTSGPLTGGTITGSGTIGITQSGVSSDGYLSSIDWNTFNNKQNALTNPVTGTGTINTLPMWSGATSLVNSPLSYGADNFNFQYNSATGGSVTFTNSGLTAYAYVIQMNNFGSPRSTFHSYTDGIVVQSIAGVQVSRIFANGNTIIGDGTVDNGRKLEIEGNLYIETIINATTDTDRFIVSDSGVIKYRTGAEILADIGAQGSLTLTTTGTSGASTLVGNTLNIPTYSTDLSGYVPYTGATGSVNLGVYSLTATSLIKNGGTSGQFLKADGSVDSSAYIVLGSLSASAPLSYNNLTGAFSIIQSGTVTDGYLSSTDWNTFNNKQGALTLTTTGTSGASTLIGNTLNIPQYTDQFTGTVTSVGLSMPSAFTVSNSPVTSSGTLTVVGAGLASQYVRGDGSLGDFPGGGGGGGASVSYYLNGSVNQGTFVGNTYYEMSKVPIFGAGTDFNIATNGYVAQFITDVNDPESLLIPAGNWNFETFFSASSGGGSPTFYVELYKYDGTTFTLIASNSATPELIAFGTNIQPYFSSLAVPETVLTITDRLAIRVYVNNSGRTITLHTEDSHLCQIVTTFTTGLTTLNGLTTQVQYFSTGTSGADFNISSAVATHTFNLPTASAVNRGALSSADWTTFDSKQPAGNYVTTDTTQTITALKTILRGGDVLNFKIGVDTLYGLKIAYNQNELVPSGEATWSFVNTFNNGIGTGLETTPISFFRGVLVTGERLLSVSVNSNLLSYYGNNPSGRYPIYAYNTGVQQFQDSILVGFNTGVVNAATGAIASLPAGVVANFNGRVIGSNAVNSNEFVTLSQISGFGTGTVTSVSFTLGATGTNLSASVATSTTTPAITLNVPTASASARGALSSTDWTTFNSKQNAITLTTTGTSGAATLVGATLNIPQYQAAGTYVTSVTGTSPIVSSGGTTPAISIPVATTSVNGYLSSTDWTTFNSKQNALTNPVTGTGTTNNLAKFTGSSTIGDSLLIDNGSKINLTTTNASVSSLNIDSTSLDHIAMQGNRFHLIGSSNYHITNNAYYDGGFKYAQVGVANKITIQSDGSFVFDNAASGTVGAGVSFINMFAINNVGDATALLSLRAPIFYDSNNTAFYLDPASTSVLNSATFSGAVTTGLLIAQGPGGNYNENIRLPGATAVISFNTSGTTGAGSYNIVSQTNFQIRNAAGTQVFVMTQGGALTMTGDISGGYIFGSYFNSSAGNSENPTIGQIWTQSTGDNYLRKSTPAHFRSQITDGVYVPLRIQSNWNDTTVINNVVGMLAWKNYGNGHVIFDASQSVSPSGTSVNATNPSSNWIASYPTLMGWNGAGTYGVRVDSARVADSAGSVDFNSLTNKTGGTATYQTSGDFRAPIFYDSNDTAYFFDGNSTSRMYQARFQNRISVGDGVGTPYLNIGSPGVWLSFNGGTDQFMGAQSTTVWGAYVGGDWRFTVNSSGTAAATGDMRAPIFYDSNNTAYYVDPAGASRMNSITYDNLYFSGDATYGFLGRNVYADTVNGRGSDPLELNYYDGGSVIIGTGANGSKALYAGSLYDSGNRVYSAANPQVNISGNAATATGQQSSTNFTINTGGAGYGLVGVYNPNVYQGLFAMGPAYVLGAGGNLGTLYGLAWTYDASGYAINTGYNLAHCMAVANNGTVYSLIGVGIWTSGLIRANGIISTAASMRAPVFYDSDDTAYFADFNSTSNSAIRLRGGMLVGPNTTWGAYLQVGGNGHVSASYANVVTTDGNLHLDAASTKAMYLNYYVNGIIYLNGTTYSISSNGSYYNGRSANSDALNGWGYTSYAYRSGGSAYYQIDTWLQMNGGHGIFWPSYYGAHIYPNTSSYTQLRLDGSKGGYGGIWDSHSGVAGIMYDSTGNGGVYREANGRWYFYYYYPHDCMGIGTSTTSSTYSLYLNKGVFAQSRIDATIYYDSANTAYYLDPSSGSYLAGSLEIANGYFLTNGVGGSIRMSSAAGSFGGYFQFAKHAVIETIVGGYHVYVLDSSGIGVVKYNGAQSWSAHSDVRIKTVHSTLENNLSKLENITPIYYSFNNFDDDKNRIGLIAQEVQQHFPELVNVDPKTDYLTLDYTGLIPVLLGAIKELKTELETLKKQL